MVQIMSSVLVSDLLRTGEASIGRGVVLIMIIKAGNHGL